MNKIITVNGLLFRNKLSTHRFFALKYNFSDVDNIKSTILHSYFSYCMPTVSLFNALQLLPERIANLFIRRRGFMG
jgi:hypothetical protein